MMADPASFRYQGVHAEREMTCCAQGVHSPLASDTDGTINVYKYTESYSGYLGYGESVSSHREDERSLACRS